ncbi:hypothetical protein [Parvimonas parva]|uniref:Uncharacterized protein n=1 Tax=Parvimonas parva TaxID=2769485 RepID=A0ABS1C962_9FIRM|nr:hypothetical protein [Parvimonas parva]MBK1468658.1 hypothetical protein [Parvimonas parva]
MKMNLKEFFENKKNRLYVGAGTLALVLALSGGIYASNRASNMKEQAKLEEQKQAEEKQKEELAKNEKEEKEKSELAKAEEQKAKEDEEKKKEEVKKAEEEKKEQEQKQAESKKEETKQSSNKNNSNTNSNSNSNNSSNNKNEKSGTESWQVEVEEHYRTTLGNSGTFFKSRAEVINFLKTAKSPAGTTGYYILTVKHNGIKGYSIDWLK